MERAARGCSLINFWLHARAFLLCAWHCLGLALLDSRAPRHVRLEPYQHPSGHPRTQYRRAGAVAPPTKTTRAAAAPTRRHPRRSTSTPPATPSLRQGETPSPRHKELRIDSLTPRQDREEESTCSPCRPCPPPRPWPRASRPLRDLGEFHESKPPSSRQAQQWKPSSQEPTA